MKIRTRLTLLFTLIFAGLLLLFSAGVYLSYADYREEEYYQQLKKQALTKANLLLDAKVAPNVLQLIYKNSPNSLYQEEIAIYDTSFHLIYHDAVEIDFVKETRSMIDEILRKCEIRFLQEGRQVVGFSLVNKGRPYVATAASYDEYGLQKLRKLKYSLLVAYLSSILAVFAAGRFFSRQALAPISGVVKQVGEISASNLDSRVNVGNGKDEIAELAATFNRMLGRLEESFDAQKHFVLNISHEMRTPLSAIIAELDIAGSKERSLEEYQQTIRLTLNDARRLAKLSNDLLDLAKAGYDRTEIKFRGVRVDELLLDAKRLVQKASPDFQVKVAYERELEDDNSVSVQGNEYLLKVAFVNLMENGCKFSEGKAAMVGIDFQDSRIILRFSDQGFGIAESDLPHIFTPFFRGTNAKRAEGNGIGLSLTEKIVKLHRGKISVASKLNEGTVVTIELPHL